MKHALPAHLQHYVKYIATREGVDQIDNTKELLPATENQKKLVQRLVKDFPESKRLLEYEDYMKYLSPFFDKHFHNIMFRVLAKAFMGSASKASVVKIVPTKKVLRLASKYYIKGDIRVIPTGIDLSHFYAENFSKEEIISLKNKLGINLERFVFGYIGRTSPEKDIKTLLNAFANSKSLWS